MTRILSLIGVVLMVGLLWLRWRPLDPCPGGPDGPYENSRIGQVDEKGTLKDGCWDGPYEMYHKPGFGGLTRVP